MTKRRSEWSLSAIEDEEVICGYSHILRGDGPPLFFLYQSDADLSSVKQTEPFVHQEPEIVIPSYTYR